MQLGDTAPGADRPPVRAGRLRADRAGFPGLDPLGIWPGVVQDPRLGCDRLPCFEAETGAQIGDYQAISEALAAATAAQAQAVPKTRVSRQVTRPRPGRTDD